MAGGIEKLQQVLVEQLNNSMISVKYIEEYVAIANYTLKKFDRVVDVVSVDDDLFNCLLEYKEPSRTKAMWVFSVVDDYNNGRKTEKIMLPINCCNKVMDAKEHTLSDRFQYHCLSCDSSLAARADDWWISKANYPRINLSDSVT